jgi:hypothetical protein
MRGFRRRWWKVSASTLPSSLVVPAIIPNVGNRAAQRFLEFFAASIENDNTRVAYYGPSSPGSMTMASADWPISSRSTSPPTSRPEGVRARRSQRKGAVGIDADRQAAFGGDPHALRLARRPDPRDFAHAVRGPKHVVERGKTPALTRGAGPAASREHQGGEKNYFIRHVASGSAIARGPARPRGDRGHGLQLRTHQRGRRDGGRGLFFERQALVGAAAQKRRQAP